MKMTLDEAIEYYIKEATQRELADEEKGDYDKWNETRFMTKKQSTQIIADNRQLAEWLMELKDLRAEQNEQYVFIHELMSELKEAKRLLKLAVEDFETIESNLEYDEHCVIKTHSIRCDECPLSAVTMSAATIYRCKWRHADEALKLIEG